MESMEIEENSNLKQGLLQGANSGKTMNRACLACRYKRYEDFVTATQYQQLQGIIEESKRKVDSSCEELLLELYKAAFPTREKPARIDKAWKDLGFQSENPMSDLRSCGLLSLNNLVYMSDHYPQVYQKLVTEATDYPFAASTFNITAILLIHLDISKQFSFCPCCGTEFKGKKAPIQSMFTFASFLEDTEWQVVFNELFSLGVVLMHNNYKHLTRTDPSFSILEFRKVFSLTSAQLLKLLRKPCHSVFDLSKEASVYLN